MGLVATWLVVGGAQRWIKHVLRLCPTILFEKRQAMDDELKLRHGREPTDIGENQI